jgi:glycosyltransferase involved in cell wall biosynthesis
MKFAIIVDDLIQHGGQEKLLTVLSQAYKDAVIYTSIASSDWKRYYHSKDQKLVTSFIDKLPFSSQLYKFYAPFLLHNIAYESFNLSEYDVVLSISSRFAHLVVTKPSTIHICYLNSPGRMFWNHNDYLRNENFGLLQRFKRFGLKFLEFPLSVLRMLDYTAAQRVDYFISNSKVVQDRVKKYYNRDSVCIYPFVDTALYAGDSSDKGYYVLITRLVSWKRVDIAVEAFNRLGLPLKIVGGGPDLKRLQHLAKNNIEFLGPVNDDIKIKTLQGCKALVQTQYEDFGIVPLEAMTIGKPVIAYGKGGVLETVLRGITGTFYYEQTPEALITCINNFRAEDYLPDVCKKRAIEFDKNLFISRIEQFIKDKTEE